MGGSPIFAPGAAVKAAASLYALTRKRLRNFFSVYHRVKKKYRYKRGNPASFPKGEKNMAQEQPKPLKEHSHGTEAFPCAIYQTKVPVRRPLVKHHWHNEVEILYFYGGDFRLEINMEQFPISCECLYFINPGELHTIISETVDNAGEEAILFDPGILSFSSYDTAQLELIQPICSGHLLFPRCVMPEDPAFPLLKDLFMETIRCFGGKPLGEAPIHTCIVTDDLITQLNVKATLLKLLACLFSSRLFTSTEKNYDKRVEGIKTVLTYIQDNYREKIYIRNLAELVNMNEQYFCRFFKKVIGRSPMDYVNEYRIRQACRLLAGTSSSVTEICLECGFNNIGNFLREFKKYKNLTPLQYRRSIPESASSP